MSFSLVEISGIEPLRASVTESPASAETADGFKMQEVSGSIPLISTRERHDEGRVFLFILDTGFPAGKGEISGKSRLPPMQARKNTLKYKR